MKSSSTAYILWLLGLLGFCGIHRFYADKPISGLIWFFTGGLCFVGQFIDLVLVPTMIDEVNVKQQVLSKRY
jgi:TM2 domain-containing membrane protein YozV